MTARAVHPRTLAAGPTRRHALFAGLCLCCLPTLGRAAESFTMEEVGPGLYVRKGLIADATPENADAIANIGFLVGRTGVVVTESGGSLADGQWLRAEIAKRTDKPITHVVLTHVHPDHVFGAGAFVQDKPVFIGHAKLPEALQARGEFYKKGLADIIGADKVGPVVMPTHTVANTDQVDLGDRVVTFKAHGPAHTHTDLSMLDKQSGLLLPADLLFVGRIPSLDGSLLGWLKELDALSKMGAQRAVPGHGPVVVDLAPSVAALRGYLGDIRDGVRKEIKGAGSIEAATRSVGQDQASKWALFADYNPRNVTEAYKELEWE